MDREPRRVLVPNRALVPGFNVETSLAIGGVNCGDISDALDLNYYPSPYAIEPCARNMPPNCHGASGDLFRDLCDAGRGPRSLSTASTLDSERITIDCSRPNTLVSTTHDGDSSVHMDRMGATQDRATLGPEPRAP